MIFLQGIRLARIRHQKQKVDYYETFTHVVKWETIRVVIGIATHVNWPI